MILGFLLALALADIFRCLVRSLSKLIIRRPLGGGAVLGIVLTEVRRTGFSRNLAQLFQDLFE